MRHFLLATSTIMLFSASAAFAIDQDAAFTKTKSFVGDTNGECVRTKWMNAGDPCAPYVPPPEPKPAPVAAPAPAPAPALPVVTLEQRTIYFDFDSDKITMEAATKLDDLSAIINASKAIADVSVHGFTDQFGKDDYNLDLANRRAAAVKAYLDGKSRLSSTLAEVKGLGKSAPEAGCDTGTRDAKIACMFKERRVEIEFKAEN
ncbi:MAG: OmpA family protein [Alphaproteobacteria bacterium]|nr:OmpA family protein [Alphaproteobacteria bacterium]